MCDESKKEFLNLDFEDNTRLLAVVWLLGIDRQETKLMRKTQFYKRTRSDSDAF